MKVDTFWNDLSTHVVAINKISEEVYEVVIRAPQAARNFKPGQLFRLNVGSHQPLPVTGAWSENDCITILITQTSFTKNILKDISIGQKVGLMGPTGAASLIPNRQSVLLIASGFGHGPMLAIANAMKKNGCVIHYVGHDPDERYVAWRSRIETHIDQCDWVIELPNINSDPYKHILIIGPPLLFEKYSSLKGAHICTTSSMQCMMKGLCGRCITPIGNNNFIWACATQDQILD